MNISAVNKATGEQIDLPANSPEEVVLAWQVAQEYEKAATALKDQLKKLVPSLVNEKGLSEHINNCQFRVNSIQRMTYDKPTLRRLVPDQDFFDELMKPDKTLIDKLLKDQDPRLWPIGHELRATMIADGNPYQVIKLERLTR